MGLNPPAAGLRRINYDARSAAKVQITVQPGDVLEVPADVADQLLRSSNQFKDIAAVNDESPANEPPANEPPANEPPANDEDVQQAAKPKRSRKV